MIAQRTRSPLPNPIIIQDIIWAYKTLFKIQQVLASFGEEFKTILSDIAAVLDADTDFARDVNTRLNREAHAFFDDHVVAFHN